MELYKVIPIGKKNKISRQELMYKAKITDVKQFRQEIAKLKEKYMTMGITCQQQKQNMKNLLKKCSCK